MSHLKRLLAPKFWKVSRKEIKWVTSPRPGPHKRSECIPLTILVRDVLGVVDTGTEARKVIKSGEVLVDGKVRKDNRYPAGFMDVVEIPKTGKQYRVVSTKKGLEMIEIPEKEAKLKLCRIMGKNLLEGGELQLSLHDGRNLRVKVKDPKKPKEDVYKTGDSLLIELPSQKIVEHVKMEKGSMVLITDGQNKGETAVIKEMIKTRSREPNKIICERDKKVFESIKGYAFVVGTKKSLVSLGGKE